LLPIGYIATALHRSRWTVLHWERMKLLPPTPYVMNPHYHRAKRRLFPEEYVLKLGQIMDQHYPGGRLEQASWRGFQERVYELYNEVVMPLLNGYPPVEIELDSGQGPGSAQGNETVSSTTSA